MAQSRKHGNSRSQLRIIGGQWRGRKFSFSPAAGLRPTPDRVRETLFNWLATTIAGARCADLFTGSGALGLEALSRGAAHCDFVDTSAAALTELQSHLIQLQATAAHCHCSAALDFLALAANPYNIVFIDPPFDQALVEPTCLELEERQLLCPGALIYIEMNATDAAPNVPGRWTLHRDKTAGGVAYRLYIAP